MSDDPKLSEQPFLSHLVELRDRLMRMVLAVLVLLLILFPFGNDIFYLLAQPVMNALPDDTSMVATKVLSPFLTPLKLAFVAAVFIAMPYLLYQLWGFIAPGLYQHEKQLAFPLLLSSIVLFYLGAAFAYYVVLPLLFPFLVGVTPEGVKVMPDIADFLDVAIRLFFAFGLAFEVPIATILLVLGGVSTPEKLAEKRPYVIVGAFVVGMLLTPPDIISQTLLALPIWVLFEIGLLFSRTLQSRRKARRSAEDSAEDEEVPLAAAAAATAGGAGTVAADDIAEGEFNPPDEQAMEEEFDRIEAEFDALEDTLPEDQEGRPQQQEDAPGDQSDIGSDDEPEEYDESDDSDDDSGPDEPSSAWTDDDSADMLDEEDEFPQRSATEALVDAKLEQVTALRATEAYDEARRLLYEVLAEGNESQVRVARNILEQLDS
jgi:sec-independent protein translocase protein TatC